MKLEDIKKVVLYFMSKNALRKYYNRLKKQTVIKKLTQAQKQEIKDYYRNNYGVKVNTKWHEILYSISGVYRVDYMPFEIYNLLLEKFSPFAFKKVLDDKVLYDWLLPDVRLPKRLFSSCNGVIYSYMGGKSEISFDYILQSLHNIDNCIIKPSKDSSAGIGVRGLSVSDGIVEGYEWSLEKLLKSYKGNFVIEEKIICCDNLRNLNPSSCNTLRIHTWRNRKENKIEYVSAFLRVGRKDSLIDNGFAGGIAIPIGDDGILSNNGCTLKYYQRYDKSDTGFTFKGYKIQQFDMMVEVVCNAHHNLPHFDFVGWDVTVNNNNEVVVIEFNPDPDMRLDQLIFLDNCLLSKQKIIYKTLFNNDKNSN